MEGNVELIFRIQQVCEIDEFCSGNIFVKITDFHSKESCMSSNGKRIRQKGSNSLLAFSFDNTFESSISTTYSSSLIVNLLGSDPSSDEMSYYPGYGIIDIATLLSEKEEGSICVCGLIDNDVEIGYVEYSFFKSENAASLGFSQDEAEQPMELLVHTSAPADDSEADSVHLDNFNDIQDEIDPEKNSLTGMDLPNDAPTYDIKESSPKATSPKFNEFNMNETGSSPLEGIVNVTYSNKIPRWMSLARTKSMELAEIRDISMETFETIYSDWSLQIEEIECYAPDLIEPYNCSIKIIQPCSSKKPLTIRSTDYERMVDGVLFKFSGKSVQLSLSEGEIRSSGFKNGLTSYIRLECTFGSHSVFSEIYSPMLFSTTALSSAPFQIKFCNGEECMENISVQMKVSRKLILPYSFPTFELCEKCEIDFMIFGLLGESMKKRYGDSSSIGVFIGSLSSNQRQSLKFSQPDVFKHCVSFPRTMAHLSEIYLHLDIISIQLFVDNRFVDEAFIPVRIFREVGFDRFLRVPFKRDFLVLRLKSFHRLGTTAAASKIASPQNLDSSNNVLSSPNVKLPKSLLVKKSVPSKKMTSSHGVCGLALSLMVQDPSLSAITRYVITKLPDDIYLNSKSVSISSHLCLWDDVFIVPLVYNIQQVFQSFFFFSFRYSICFFISIWFSVILLTLMLNFILQMKTYQ